MRYRGPIEFAGRVRFGIALLAPLLLGAASRAASASSSLPAGTGPGWLTSISRTIGEGEYHLSPDSAGDGFTAPNRAHDLRCIWRDGARELIPRTDPAAWKSSYRLLGVVRLGGSPFIPAAPIRHRAVSAGHIEWSRVP